MLTTQQINEVKVINTPQSYQSYHHFCFKTTLRLQQCLRRKRRRFRVVEEGFFPCPCQGLDSTSLNKSYSPSRLRARRKRSRRKRESELTSGADKSAASPQRYSVTCFTSTKVQILTQIVQQEKEEEQAQARRRQARSITSERTLAAGTQFTCFTITKVQIY